VPLLKLTLLAAKVKVGVPVSTLPTVPAALRLSVEKSPVPGVVPPMVPGAANVFPFKVEAFRLGTLVVLDTVNGAVPVAIVETNAGAEILLLDVIALAGVPAAAGQVKVALPLVPYPVKMQATEPETPQLFALKSPAPGVVPPIVPGAAQLFPKSSDAFRLGTFVVEVTCSGAVPIATVETSAGAERLLLETIALAGVPAAAGQVSVAEPLVP